MISGEEGCSMALTDKDIQAIQTLLLPMYGRLDRVDIRLDKLDSEVSSLRAGQLEIRKDIKNVDRKVSDTYNLALEAWGTSTENRVWLEGINPRQDGKGV